jgi:negative regulator of flagellin synthesis FlgM
MNVNGIHSSMAAQGIEPIGNVNAASQAAAPMATNDVVEISTAAKLAAKIHEIPDVRAELVAQVKAQIASGEYETPEKIDSAVSRLMDELFPGA